ncbi:MAG: porin family protein [Balneolaceae bacterium]|jgi:hypothetical protein
MKRACSIPALLIVFLTSFSLPRAQAQLGIRAGINFANFHDNPGNFDPDSRTGLMIGGYYNFNIPMSPASIQPEVLYTQNGYEDGGTTLKLDYLQIPVLAKFTFAPGPISPKAYIGPYVGFVLNNEFSGGVVIQESDKAQTDFGGILGAGIDFNAGVTKLNLGIRYGFGFRDALERGQGKNSVLSIVGGISL